MSSSLIASRSISGSTSSSRNPVKCSRPIVARSRARALDPQHRDLAARVVDRRPLRRRVAAAEVGDGAVRAEQVGGDAPARRAGRRARRRRARGRRPRRSAGSGCSSGDLLGIAFGGHAAGVAGVAQRGDGVLGAAARRCAPARTAGGRRCGRRRAAARGRRARRRPPARRAARRASTSSAFAYASCRLTTLSTIASTFGSTLCDWSIVSRGSGPAGRDELGEDQEQLERVDRADDQVVVRVLAVVEVEAAEPALVRQEGDDLLDVGALGVVAEVDEHAGARAEPHAGEHGGAPVGQVGRVERGLEELVLDEQLLLLGQRGVDLLEAAEQPPAARAQVVLAGVVRPVREPQRLRGRPQRGRDLRRTRACARWPSRGWRRRDG